MPRHLRFRRPPRRSGARARPQASRPPRPRPPQTPKPGARRRPQPGRCQPRWPKQATMRCPPALPEGGTTCGGSRRGGQCRRKSRRAV
eukprot:scaffold4839_cov136-Isochrysis_galbana.AAC.7